MRGELGLNGPPVSVDQRGVGSNELALVRLEVDVLLSTRAVRALTPAERDRLTDLLGRECELRGLDDAAGGAENRGDG
jgi:hypothetical protein